MKKCILLLWGIFLLIRMEALSQSRQNLEKYYNSTLQVLHYVPGGMMGIFEKKDPIRFRLAMRSQKDAKVQVEITVLDFEDRKAGNKLLAYDLKKGKAQEFSFSLPNPGRYGHFVLDTKIRLDGKLAVLTQSAFSVLPPALKKVDPFFEIDGRNPHQGVDMTRAYRRIGVGTIGLNVFLPHYKDPAIFYKSYFAQKNRVYFPQVTGYIYLGEVSAEKEPEQLRKQGFFPFSPEYYKRWDQIVRTCAELGKGTIKLWVLVQEVDGHMTIPRYSALAVMADHVIRVKRFSRILKEVNPECKVAVVNSCGDDFFSNNFRYTRMLLKETAKYVDYFGIDGYSGNWNGKLVDLTGPEDRNDGFKALMEGSIAVAKEFQLPGEVLQAERGYYIPYMDAFNSKKSRDLANFDTRSILVARSIKGVRSYSRHTACRWHIPYSLSRNPKLKADSLTDGGLWRCVFDMQKRYCMQPRAALNAFDTVTRMLSFVTDPHALKITKEIYASHFKRPDGKRVAALWTTGKNTRMKLDLPADALIYDLMGNALAYKKGTQILMVKESPCFIVLPGNASQISAMLKKADFPDIKTFDAFARRIPGNAYRIYLASYSNKPLEIAVRSTDKVTSPAKVTLLPGKGSSFIVKGEKGSVTLQDGRKEILLSLPTRKLYKIPYGKSPRKIAEVCYPGSIRPVEALRAERNLFRCDGSDIKGEFAASWDENNLYCRFTVQDRTHLQRQSGGQIWRDDAIQIAIDAGNNGIPSSMMQNPGYDKDDHVLGFALTKKSPVSYAWFNGSKPGGPRNYPLSITRKNGMTLYKVTIPWKEIPPVQGVKGAIFGMNFVIMDNNDPAFRTAPYFLVWTDGLAGKGGKDTSKFNTLILE